MNKVMIFDFDGTIAKTFNLTVKITNRLSDDLGYKKINEKNARLLRNCETEKTFRILGLPSFKLPLYLERLRKEMNDEIEFAKPIPGIKKVLPKLRKKGYRLGMVTSNSKENVKKFLKKNNLDLFDFVYSGSSIFGKSRLINKALKERKLRADETFFVGDETRDIEAARRAKIKIISVSLGFNSKEVLKKQKPDFLISKPAELATINF
jgi:HAD superfamily hydrolase (TIGR01549 family)